MSWQDTLSGKAVLAYVAAHPAAFCEFASGKSAVIPAQARIQKGRDDLAPTIRNL
jgi:hypothetical protein